MSEGSKIPRNTGVEEDVQVVGRALVAGFDGRSTVVPGSGLRSRSRFSAGTPPASPRARAGCA